MAMINVKSTTWLDQLPTEIIFEIFHYLSNNDIIYTFFYFSQRFNNLVLQNQRYLTHLELPIVDFYIWANIFATINSQIESLNISTIYLSFPLTLFPNLKSIIISSLYTFPDEQLLLICESDQFKNLHSLRIKEKKIPLDSYISYYYFTDKNNLLEFFCQVYLLKRVMNHENSLRVFQYSSAIPSLAIVGTNAFERNFNLHSLTLKLTLFEDIFSLIEYTPNLKYLNLESKSPYVNDQPIKKINIKLKHLYLKLNHDLCESDSLWPRQIDFDQLANGIEQFSSSLICLSLNLVDSYIKCVTKFLFDSTKLKQLLESMIELKQFHLCAKIEQYEFDPNVILSSFRDQFWFDHNWSFGIHGGYFYTLPFRFNYLYDFYGKFFHDIKLNYPEIPNPNPRKYHNVKTIHLVYEPIDDLRFMKLLKITLPNLTTIKFINYRARPFNKIQNLFVRNKIQLDSVTTVYITDCSIEIGSDWLIYALPNLKHLILSSTKFSSVQTQLVPILSKNIHLYINNAELEQFTKSSYAYFSNVQHIHFCYEHFQHRVAKHANFVMQILKNFNNLKTLVIYRNVDSLRFSGIREIYLKELIVYLDINEIKKNYQVKHFPAYVLFSKKTFHA